MSPNPPVSLPMREWDQLKVIEAVVQTGWKRERALTTSELSILAARTDDEVANALAFKLATDRAGKNCGPVSNR
ncbi:hypothetical protein [Caballeronia grimmiae]|uniref:Uncharacterized protein n=1 Tax=Caballeronia grimmiae TaxID=1071679 RepID=A0ABQ1RPU1_9BURK|nr:hypothetical protein [Caballeronia grimmiae]GGD75348.1 hypothetical protein GCM10010985_32350 [Caballeronia grimmiae]